MADLRYFVYPGLKSGTNVTLYDTTGNIKIGSGRVDTVEELQLQITGSLDILGKHYDLKIKVVMPDDSLKGTCTVLINENTSRSNYWVESGRLNFELYSLQLYTAGKFTWAGKRDDTFAWVGIWPADQIMSEADKTNLPTLAEA